MEKEFCEEFTRYKMYVRQFTAMQLGFIKTYTADQHIDFPNYPKIEKL